MTATGLKSCYEVLRAERALADTLGDDARVQAIDACLSGDSFLPIAKREAALESLRDPARPWLGAAGEIAVARHRTLAAADAVRVAEVERQEAAAAARYQSGLAELGVVDKRTLELLIAAYDGSIAVIDPRTGRLELHVIAAPVERGAGVKVAVAPELGLNADARVGAVLTELARLGRLESTAAACVGVNGHRSVSAAVGPDLRDRREIALHVEAVRARKAQLKTARAAG